MKKDFVTIKALNCENKEHTCEIFGEPDSCPLCSHKIKPLRLIAYIHGRLGTYNLEIVYTCPNNNCNHLFITYYHHIKDSESFFLGGSELPLKIDRKEFPDIIKQISNMFPKIYNQALLAEKNGLDQICGGGYRRALEFLIKDYLTSLTPEKGAEIKKIRLGDAIKKIDNKNIRSCAERAAWLGNDETHYIRKWEDKDIENLKDLIDLVVMWIDSEERTRKYEREMKK